MVPAPGLTPPPVSRENPQSPHLLLFLKVGGRMSQRGPLSVRLLLLPALPLCSRIPVSLGTALTSVPVCTQPLCSLPSPPQSSSTLSRPSCLCTHVSGTLARPLGVWCASPRDSCLPCRGHCGMMTQGFLGGFRDDILSLSRSVTGDRSDWGPFRRRATWATPAPRAHVVPVGAEGPWV